jgi:signal transduction histidine kinase
MVAPSPGTRVSRRALILVGLGVALPAILLAGLGIYLTLRIARVVEDESARYNSYIALQVGEAFERELLAALRRSIPPAETAARSGADTAAMLEALRTGVRGFSAPHFVSETELPGTTGLVVESTALLYVRGEGARRVRMFAGLLLRGPQGEVLGAGGWWFDPRRFLLAHFEEVVQDRLPENPRLYGGIVSTRRLSVALLGPYGEELLRVRQPGHARSARIEPLSGPFGDYAVRVAPALGAPAVWVTRFFGLMIGFIGLMGLATVVAALAGLMYASRQLELARLKTSFVSNVTHELKTPIALIRLAAETLELRRFSTPEEGQAFLGSIVRETVRLQQLVDNILDFARLEAGQTVFRFEAVDLPAIVRETVDDFRPRLEQKGFQIELDLPEGLPPVRGDAVMLQHCVLNLLDNALKYSRARREVRVSVKALDGAVAASVTDHGIGIAPADQKRIFEKFVRVEAGLVHDVKGAGLGLSLVQQIVRAHGGRVELESSPGEGSTFTVLLPLADGTEAPRRGARHARSTDPERETAS